MLRSIIMIMLLGDTHSIINTTKQKGFHEKVFSGGSSRAIGDCKCMGSER